MNSDAEAPAAIRTFIAISPRPEQIAGLKQVQQRLQARLRNDTVRWAGVDQLHLTLRFLGHVAKADLPGLVEALHSACAGAKAFTLGLAGAGCFPNSQAPRIIWVGVGGELERLGQLHKRIERLTGCFGDHAEKREFHPHLTIGRVKPHGREARRAGELIENTPVPDLGSWEVRQVDLVQSELSSQGACYTPLAAAPLAN